MNLTHTNPNHPSTNRTPLERPRAPWSFRKKAAALGMAGLTLVGIHAGAVELGERPAFEPIEIPAEDDKVIVYTAKVGDMGPQKIASHFESNREEGRLDALTDLIQREANITDGVTEPGERAQIEPGETFRIPADEFTLVTKQSELG